MVLTGFAALIAISEKGMYAAHIWEDAAGGILAPSEYKATLAAIEIEWTAHENDLAGGHLYLMILRNPDQPTEMLYDSPRWNKGPTGESEADKNLEWTKAIRKVGDFRNMAKEGSCLSIPEEVHYMPPKLGEQLSLHMIAQYDPTAKASKQVHSI
ncbi:MAG: hypothetical protein MMC23_004967 [Stictis urceolatum]|nr:hypothetical protein [Stictis urceolata]